MARGLMGLDRDMGPLYGPEDASAPEELIRRSFQERLREAYAEHGVIGEPVTAEQAAAGLAEALRRRGIPAVRVYPDPDEEGSFVVDLVTPMGVG